MGGIEVLREKLHAIYDDYRTIVLNKKYYGHRLHSSKQRNIALQIAIALGTTAASLSAGVGLVGLSIWDTMRGDLVLPVLTFICALIAIANPFLNYGDRIERYSILFSRCSIACVEIENVVRQVRQEKNISRNADEAYARFRSVFMEVAAKDDPKPILRLVKKFEAEVEKEIPANTLWMP